MISLGNGICRLGYEGGVLSSTIAIRPSAVKQKHELE